MKRAVLFSLGLAGLVLAVLPAAGLELMPGVNVGLGQSAYFGEDHRDELSTHNYEDMLYLRPSFGAFLDIRFSERFSVQPELQFQFSGAKYGSGPDDYEIERFTYLRLPVLAAVGFALGPGRLRVFGGPGVNFLLGTPKRVVESPGSSSEAALTILASPILSATAGLGYALGLGPGELRGELRYTATLSRVYDQEVNVDDRRVGALVLVAGYGFDLSKSKRAP